jgi:hypothetical protein
MMRLGFALLAAACFCQLLWFGVHILHRLLASRLSG